MKNSEYKLLKSLAKRFQKMMSSGDIVYFDQDDLIDIIDFYLYEFEMDYAEQAIDYAISFYPEQSLFRLQKVKKLILEFEFEEAKEELQYVEDQYLPSVEFYVEKIFLTRIIYPDTDISDLLQKAFTLDPRNPDVHFFYAYEAVKNRDIEKALTHIYIVLEEDDEFEEQFYAFSFLFEEQELFEDAYHFYKAITEKYPLMKAAWFGLGLSCNWLECHQEAIDNYQLAISLDDNMSSAYFNIGNSYYELKQYENALTQYKIAYEIDEWDVNFVNSIADCYTMLNQYEEAKKYYNIALNIYPTSTDAIRGIISILEQFGKNEEIPAFTEKVFMEAPQNFELLFEVLDFYSDKEKIEKLEQLFQLTFIQINEKKAFFNLFILYCCRYKWYDYGITILEKYFDLEIIADEISYYFSALYYLNGNYPLGNEYLSQALSRFYAGYEDFLNLDPALKNNEDIMMLIDIYKP